MFGDHQYARRSALPIVPTGWRRNGIIGITATVLMTGGLLLAAATTDGAGAATAGPGAKTDQNCTAIDGAQATCAKR